MKIILNRMYQIALLALTTFSPLSNANGFAESTAPSCQLEYIRSVDHQTSETQYFRVIKNLPKGYDFVEYGFIYGGISTEDPDIWGFVLPAWVPGVQMVIEGYGTNSTLFCEASRREFLHCDQYPYFSYCRN